MVNFTSIAEDRKKSIYTLAAGGLMLITSITTLAITTTGVFASVEYEDPRDVLLLIFVPIGLLGFFGFLLGVISYWEVVDFCRRYPTEKIELQIFYCEKCGRELRGARVAGLCPHCSKEIGK